MNMRIETFFFNMNISFYIQNTEYELNNYKMK